MEYRVTVFEKPDSTTYLVDTIIESKHSPKAIINRYIRKYPDAYEVTVEKHVPQYVQELNRIKRVYSQKELFA